MDKKLIYYFLAGLIFGICCYISFSIGQSYPKTKETKVEIKKDTLVVKDTISIKKPLEKIKWKDKIVYVPTTSIVTNTDTLIVYKNDTTYLEMQAERVEYEGEDYKAIISGVCPKLEEISVYPKTTYITETQKEIVTNFKHWNFNITIGPGIIYNGKINYGVGTIIGFGYSF